MNNQIYGVEQLSVNPNPFREDMSHYKEESDSNPFTESSNALKPIQNEILQDMYQYNVLHEWNYEEMTKVVGGGKALKVKNYGELLAAIELIKADPEGFYIVNVKVPSTDSPYT
mmetsp:Transcript_35703/g.34738  ORF Transcript_35703/g.34738 Transcript_35703/m.34738 type:complete len:114 (+) Transcript_35703:1560-1901(+)